jgi:hypothetical protein
MLTKKIIVLLFCLLALNASTLFAQDTLLLRDYSFVRQSSPWLIQRNAAALTLYSSQNIAEAELSLSHANGRLAPANGSPSLTTLQAAIESYYRINARMVVYGAISYDNQSGSDMTGSVFMQDRLPFDIVEDSLNNAGRKHRDTYHLTGAFGYDVYNGYSIGVKADYTAANYAKYKDLRHKNKLMDLQLTAGVFLPIASWLDVGLDYTYHRRTESLEFATYGKSDKTYKSLIDHGALMGIVEQFGNDGYTDKSNEMPLFEDGHGAGLQLSLEHGAFSLFNDLSYSHSTGYSGRKSPFTITYTDHDRDIVANHVRLTYTPSSAPSASSTSRHSIDLRYRHERLLGRINTYRGLTNQNGATHYEYYDAADNADKRWRNLDVDYTLHLGIRHELPTWTITAGYHWQQRDITAYLYPYYRQQQLRTNEWTAGVARNFVMQKGVWNIAVKGGYQKGSGAPYNDGTFVTPSEKQPQPATMEALLWREYQYLTAPQWNFGAQLKYMFLIPATRLRSHIRAAIDYRHASTSAPDDVPAALNDPQRTAFTLAAGITF